MVSTMRLRSVVHSIAHYGVSGLCYIHPHLGQACKKLGVDRAEINLLAWNAKSQFEETDNKIAGAACALCEQFSAILQSENILPDDLAEATALFFFARDNWPIGCYVRVVSTSGRSIDVAVDDIGNPAEIIDR